jgi:arginyl-tRNA synthetase
MTRIKEKIKKDIQGILNEMGAKADTLLVEVPTDSKYGDLTSNIAMQISKDLKSNPMDIANDIVSKYAGDEDIEKVEVVKPGFINFFFSKRYLLNVLKEINTDSSYFKLDTLKGKKYMVEYTDPNPFKTFHIGHLYTNMVGQSFSCLLEALGASVVRANYQGDVGLHVAKSMWGLMEMLKKDGLSFDSLSRKSLEERVRYLGDAYILGFKMYDDYKDEQVISLVNDINHFLFCMYIPRIPKKEYSFNTVEVSQMYLEGRQWCLEYFEKIYRKLGTKFDKYYFESNMGEKGLNIVMDNIEGKGKSFFKRSQNAIVYEGKESKGLHTRVFVNSKGLPTYEAKELALAFKKFEDFNLDESVTITADEQTSYFKVVFDALSQLDSTIANKSKHIPHGMVKLPGAEKMASRKGKIIEGEWLINETKKKVQEIMFASGKWSNENIAKISENIAIAAIKYSFVKVSVGKDVIFDFEKSITFDGDTGPYLLYVYARCKSILQESGEDQKIGKEGDLDANTKGLLRVLSKYKEVVLVSAQNYSPANLCTYLFELGQAFNSFYQNVRVLDSKEKDFLLAVVSATAMSMKEGLKLLGIEVVERM